MTRKLGAQEWQAVRSRWEGSPQSGFDWLAREIRSAWGVFISRQGIAKMARKDGDAWVKGGGPSQPLSYAVAAPQRTETSQQDSQTGSQKPAAASVARVLGPSPALQVRDDEPPIGRTPGYRPEHCRIAKHMCLLGATDEDLGNYFGVAAETVRNWCDRHEEFDLAVRAGKQHADARVAASLYTRAVGYTSTVNKPMAVPVGGGVSEVRIVTYEEYVAPDVKAAQTWLYNRRPQDWKASVTFTPAPPNSIADTKLLDAIYERKQAAARELQARVSDRMQRLGLVFAMSTPETMDSESDHG